MEQNETLEKDVVLALALASGASVTEAAASVGVDRTTIDRNGARKRWPPQGSNKLSK